MMKQLRLDYPTSVLSRMLVVSASGYYAWEEGKWVGYVYLNPTTEKEE